MDFHRLIVGRPKKIRPGCRPAVAGQAPRGAATVRRSPTERDIIWPGAGNCRCRQDLICRWLRSGQRIVDISRLHLCCKCGIKCRNAGKCDATILRACPSRQSKLHFRFRPVVSPPARGHSHPELLSFKSPIASKKHLLTERIIEKAL